MNGDAELFKLPEVASGSMTDYHPISAEDQSRIHQFGQKFYLEYFKDMHHMLGECGKEFFSSQTLRSLNIWTRQKSMLENSTQRNYLRRKMVNTSCSRSQMEQLNCLKEIMESENPHQCRINPWVVKTSAVTFMEVRRNLNQKTKQTITWKPATIFGRSKGISFIAITSNSVFSCACRKKKHSQFHNSTEIHGREQDNAHKFGRVAEEPYWWLVERWCGSKFVRHMDRIHEVHIIIWKTSTGYMWSRRRLTKTQATTRPDNLWPDVWSTMGNAAKKKDKHQQAIEKPKLDNARKRRDSYFIWSRGWRDQGNHLKNARKRCLVKRERGSA